MPRDDAGSLARVGRGCPTIYHEGLINKYCESWGFVKYGFGRFMKNNFLCQYSNRKISPAEMFSPLQDKPSQNSINKSLKRQTKSITDSVPLNTCDYGCQSYEVYCDGCLGDEVFGCDWFGSHKPDVFCEMYDKQLTAIPDCWRYNGIDVEVIEVCDSSITHFDKLIKYSLIHDMMHQCFDNEFSLRVFEYFIRTGTMVEHDLTALFELWEHNEWMSGSMNKKEQARSYQNYTAGRQLQDMQFQIERL